MITETFLAAIEAVNKPSTNLNSTLKDVGIFHYEFQPQTSFRHGYKKTSIRPNCLAIGPDHIFAAQANKAVIHVYSREKGNQEATVPFPDRICSLAYAEDAAILVIGTEDGKLILWEIASGRIITSSASHLEAVSSLTVTKNNEHIISGSADSNVHVWSVAQLVGFSRPSQLHDDTSAASGPSRTFSHHREAVTALATGHSRTNTNFAVSASRDRTCFLWHIETCQILRTFLVPDAISSMTLDPADRAIYLASNNGGILSIDLAGQSSSARSRSIYDTAKISPIQIEKTDYWSGQSPTYGTINCLTLSYDATNLLSGHADGTIVRWDVANHRLISDIAHLQQPVSSIHMLIPDGLLRLRRYQKKQYIIPTVTKPRLDLNAESIESKLGIPTSYSLGLQNTQRPSLSLHASSSISATASALAGGLFPDSMMDEAIQAMHSKNASTGTASVATSKSTSASAGPNNDETEDGGTNKNDTYKIQSLEEEKALLQKKLAVMQKLYDEIQERHRARSERRGQIAQQRREAYFTAAAAVAVEKLDQNGKGKGQGKGKGKGGDHRAEREGDLAMKPFDQQLDAIDAASDEEELERAAEARASMKADGMHLD